MSNNNNINLGQVFLTAVLTTALTFLVFKVYTDYQIKQYKTIIEKTLGIDIGKTNLQDSSTTTESADVQPDISGFTVHDRDCGFGVVHKIYTDPKTGEYWEVNGNGTEILYYSPDKDLDPVESVYRVDYIGQK
jgi:hypothetical protein